ncbi:MAG: oxidoreductase [Opitutaceae bacterium]|nr:oxidoreductase [Opitutaceae bacterium]|tara:strand:+ start:249 stop:1616 length:1368 start_codon:yes stop_codon:yes gene_type:complete
MNRCDFLKKSSAAFAFSTLPTLQALSSDFIDIRKRVALIGSGWYGKLDLFRLIQVAPVEVVSICDVDANMANDAADQVAGRQMSGKRPRVFGDYRKLLKEKDFDIVLIDTPDHWHAMPMIEAVKAGADVYVQKPTSVDVVESQAMLAAARKYNRVVQVGTQRRSTPHLIEARDRVINEGLLGEISHADICCYYHMRRKTTIEEAPNVVAPPNLDWDMYTGPAPMRPYNSIIHPRGWRAFREYCNGIVGDMCVHMLDMVRWQLDLGMPSNISSVGGIYMDKAARANITDTQTATFQFPEMNVVWNHRTWGDPPDPEYPWSAIIYGNKGTLKMSVHKYDFIPHKKRTSTLNGSPLFEFEQYPIDRTEDRLEKHVSSAVRWHMLDFLRAVESRDRPVADIEQGHISSISCLLANNSMALGRSLEWDEKAGKVVNDEQANELLIRPYRKPWKHPHPKRV